MNHTYDDKADNISELEGFIEIDGEIILAEQLIFVEDPFENDHFKVGDVKIMVHIDPIGNGSMIVEKHDHDVCIENLTFAKSVYKKLDESELLN